MTADANSVLKAFVNDDVGYSEHGKHRANKTLRFLLFIPAVFPTVRKGNGICLYDFPCKRHVFDLLLSFYSFCPVI